ncbi:hypothetical protein FJT64_021018 [Amphibalanus amphitrite]|uniref:Uncharacterized protein n=1 Tax=Amphibalanus amphitrite TaxID=1232801 RepID=A0A6A4WYY7_AMPAM|nr:hypothetical protein FJT64_021018 [Amphibalanus amphitrite]
MCAGGRRLSAGGGNLSLSGTFGHGDLLRGFSAEGGGFSMKWASDALSSLCKSGGDLRASGAIGGGDFFGDLSASDAPDGVFGGLLLRQLSCQRHNRLLRPSRLQSGGWMGDVDDIIVSSGATASVCMKLRRAPGREGLRIVGVHSLLPGLGAPKEGRDVSFCHHRLNIDVRGPEKVGQVRVRR